MNQAALNFQILNNIFLSYYGDPLLYKVKDKETDFSLYGIQYQSSLKCKLFLLVKTKYLGDDKRLNLKNLPWISINFYRTNEVTEYDHLPKVLFPYQNVNGNNVNGKIKTIQLESKNNQKNHHPLYVISKFPEFQFPI